MNSIEAVVSMFPERECNQAIFMGAGEVTDSQCYCLHRRLEKALRLLDSLQFSHIRPQPVTPDNAGEICREARYENDVIAGIVADIAVALTGEEWAPVRLMDGGE